MVVAVLVVVVVTLGKIPASKKSKRFRLLVLWGKINKTKDGEEKKKRREGLLPADNKVRSSGKTMFVK